MATKQVLDIDYTKYNFRDSTEDYEYKFPQGLTREVVERISKIKNEPDWMRRVPFKVIRSLHEKTLTAVGR